MEILLQAQIGKETLSLGSGKLAKQASGAVMVQYGETMVLVTVVADKNPKPEVNFMPLSVEYMEKIYSAGRIPGNYFRREIGRPSEKETLTARLTDRPLRPLFPKDWRYETQVIATVLSMDKANDPDVLAINGASAALLISDIPFDGPVACVRVGRINGELIANPTIDEQKTSDLNIIVAGSRTGIVMVEGGCDNAVESDVLDAIFFAHAQIQPILDLQEKLRESIGKPKREHIPRETDPELSTRLESLVGQRMAEALTVKEKQDRQKALSELKAAVIEDLGDAFAERQSEIKEIFYDLERKVLRNIILDQGRRIDGRGFTDVRPIQCEAALLPRVHGSGLFTRGETQVLAAMTMGSGRDEQRVETLSGEESVQFMLHYNFPPYSVGEVKRVMGPSRRDIGHGNLARRAMENMLPPKEEFDYTIRIVSEVLESNGSSSMGTVCAATLALMDGGVPIKAPVSGIAMGLVSEGDRVVVLSDILGDEDHAGDMDFKVAGTKDGITALQMDIKIKELSREVLKTALEQAKTGRLHILDKMLETLAAPRDEMSPYAPHVHRIHVNPERIGDIIGPGGKIIRSIQSETNTQIEIDDTGLVKISSFTKEEGDKAVQIITEIGSDPEIGAIYDGTVVKITDFGAFVQIRPKTEGLVHISELAPYRVKKVRDIVKEGDVIKVKVIEISREGKIKLSRKAALGPEEQEKEKAPPSE